MSFYCSKIVQSIKSYIHVIIRFHNEKINYQDAKLVTEIIKYKLKYNTSKENL